MLRATINHAVNVISLHTIHLNGQFELTPGNEFPFTTGANLGRTALKGREVIALAIVLLGNHMTMTQHHTSQPLSFEAGGVLHPLEHERADREHAGDEQQHRVREVVRQQVERLRGLHAGEEEVDSKRQGERRRLEVRRRSLDACIVRNGLDLAHTRM